MIGDGPNDGIALKIRGYRDIFCKEQLTDRQKTFKNPDD